MESRNKILETLISNKNADSININERVINVQNEVKTLADEIKNTNEKLESVLIILSKFIDKNKQD